MKKKLLLLILLIIPFMVKAEDTANDLTKIWSINDQAYEGTYDATHTMIKYSNNKYLSLQRFGGIKKEINVNDKKHFHLFENDKFLLITQEYSNGKAKATLYDEKFNEIKTTDLGTIDIDFCKHYNENYIAVSGNTRENGEYYRIIYFIKHDGTIYKQDKIKTVNKTEAYYMFKGNNSTEDMFADFNNNVYRINNYKLVPANTNADGTYTILKDNKLMNYNTKGNKVKEVSIPDAVDVRIAKKDNKYYLESGIYSQQVVNDKTKTYYRVKLYLYNESLEKLKEAETEQNENSWLWATNTSGFSRSYHDIVNNKGKIYLAINRTNNDTLKYEISDDLTLTQVIEGYARFYNNNSYYRLTENNYGHADYSDDSTYQRILSLKNSNNNVNGIIYKKDGDNIAALVTYNKKENNKTYTKLELVYYNKSFQEKFSKEIYNWTLAYEGDSCGSQIVANDIGIFDKYITVLANSNENNYFLFFNKNGQQVRDLSSDINKKELSIGRLITYERGVYIELQKSHIQCSYGATMEDESNGVVLGVEGNLNSGTYMAYYSYPFLIKTETVGKGKIKAEEVKALSGTLVKFTVEPEKGYVLSVVKVTDADGNVITFTDYTFTMPSADVTIEAVFIPLKNAVQTKNPDTKVLGISIIVIISLISGILYLYTKKRTKENRVI